MTPDEFIYENVKTSLLNSNIPHSEATTAALKAMEDYKKGRYPGRATDLIKDTITSAKKLAKKRAAAIKKQREAELKKAQKKAF